jgi:hypothetical protein
MRYRDQNGQDWADIIDILTTDPEARRKVVRLLGENRRFRFVILADFAVLESATLLANASVEAVQRRSGSAPSV